VQQHKIGDEPAATRTEDLAQHWKDPGQDKQDLMRCRRSVPDLSASTLEQLENTI
jgi:hypothetical protein